MYIFLAERKLILSCESGEEDPGVFDIPRRLLSCMVLCLRLFLLKGESWLRAATLDDSKNLNSSLTQYKCGCMKPLLRPRHHPQVKQAVKT